MRFSGGAGKNSDRARDTGLAVTLLLLFWAVFTKNIGIVVPAVATLMLSMALPIVFAPLSPLWFGLTERLGTIVSGVVLSLLFFGLLMPIGLIRRLLGADPLCLKTWKAGNGSAFAIRRQKIEPDHLQKPF